MEHTNYIGAGELVFSTDKENGINSGGFDVKSIMMKAGISPIMTLNGQSGGGDMNKVSDLFDSLVIPNWALSYNNRIIGGHGKDIKKNYDSDDNSEDENNEEIEDDLHDKFIGVLAIAFNEEYKLTKEDWIFIRQKAGVIGTLLDEYLNAKK